MPDKITNAADGCGSSLVWGEVTSSPSQVGLAVMGAPVSLRGVSALSPHTPMLPHAPGLGMPLPRSLQGLLRRRGPLK